MSRWVRIHPNLRKRSFHPVHGSTPWDLDRSTGERITVVHHCPSFRWERTVRREERSASFEGVSEWKGYTLFKLRPLEHQRTSSSTGSEPQGRFKGKRIYLPDPTTLVMWVEGLRDRGAPMAEVAVLPVGVGMLCRMKLIPRCPARKSRLDHNSPCRSCHWRGTHPLVSF